MASLAQSQPSARHLKDSASFPRLGSSKRFYSQKPDRCSEGFYVSRPDVKKKKKKKRSDTAVLNKDTCVDTHHFNKSLPVMNIKHKPLGNTLMSSDELSHEIKVNSQVMVVHQPLPRALASLEAAGEHFFI